jgi:hypothetical protein
MSLADASCERAEVTWYIIDDAVGGRQPAATTMFRVVGCSLLILIAKGETAYNLALMLRKSIFDKRRSTVNEQFVFHKLSNTRLQINHDNGY